MIDYEKLKLAHELAARYAADHNETSSIMHHYYGASNQSYFEWQTYSHEHFKFQDINDLIIKLQELTQPKPKYEVGQKVFVLHGDKIHSFVIHEIIDDGEFWYLHYISDGDYSDGEQNFDQYREDILYSTREALLEAQIKYWTNLKRRPDLPCEG